MPALIGALMLMGIVTKNSILLIERAVDNEATRGILASTALSLLFVPAFSLLLDKAERVVKQQSRHKGYNKIDKSVKNLDRKKKYLHPTQPQQPHPKSKT